MENKIQANRGIIILLVIALALRLALLTFCWRDPSALSPDSSGYISLGANLAAHGVFAVNFTPEILRTPGYPVFLAASGVSAPLGFGTAQLLQVLLDVLLVFLTYVLGTRLVNRRAGLWAAGFQACSGAAILSSVDILSDGLFSFLMTIAILLVIRYIEDKNWRFLALGGVFTAAATYVRPVGIIFVPIVVLVLLFRNRRFVNVPAFLGIYAALVSPWIVRNYVEAGYVGLSTISDYNLLFYEAAAVSAKVQGGSVERARQDLNATFQKRVEEENIRPDSAGAMYLARNMGQQVLRAHPALFLRIHLLTTLTSLLPSSTGLLETLGVTQGGRGTLSVLQTEGLWSALKHYFGSNILAMVLILPDLILVGVRYLAVTAYVLKQVLSRGIKLGPVAWFAGLTVIAFILVAGPGAVPRYRLPVEPLLNVSAGAGAAMLLKRKRKPLLMDRGQLGLITNTP